MPQKLRSSEVQQRSGNQDKNTANSQNRKVKFQTPSTYNDDRNFVRHNSVEKFSPNLVYPTKSDTSSVSDSIFYERREEIAEDVPAHAEDVPASAPAPPAPALHWRQSKNDHTLQEQGSQHARTLGNQPAHIVTLTYRHYLNLD